MIYAIRIFTLLIVIVIALFIVQVYSAVVNGQLMAIKGTMYLKPIEVDLRGGVNWKLGGRAHATA